MLPCVFEADIIALKPRLVVISEHTSFALTGSEIQGRRLSHREQTLAPRSLQLTAASLAYLSSV